MSLRTRLNFFLFAVYNTAGKISNRYELFNPAFLFFNLHFIHTQDINISFTDIIFVYK